MLLTNWGHCALGSSRQPGAAMPVLVVSNPKGGTGKSTTSLVLATTLARHGASVTLFDCDPNRHLVAWRNGPTKSAVQVVGHAEATNIARMLKSEGGCRKVLAFTPR